MFIYFFLLFEKKIFLKKSFKNEKSKKKIPGTKKEQNIKCVYGILAEFIIIKIYVFII